MGLNWGCGLSPCMSDGMQWWSPATPGPQLLPGGGHFARCLQTSGLWGGERSCACRRANGAPGMEEW